MRERSAGADDSRDEGSRFAASFYVVAKATTRKDMRNTLWT